jgi:hypothetical protein
LQLAQAKAEQARLAAEAQAKAAADALAAAQQKAEQERLAAQAQAAEEARQQQIAAQAAQAAAAAAAQQAAASSSQPAAPRSAPFVLSSNYHTKVSNIDIFSRSLDRSEMTISVDYDFARDDGSQRMGVDMVSSEDPTVSGYFSCPAVDVGRSSHNSILFPIKLQSAAADAFRSATLPTDKIWIYFVDGAGIKSYIFQSTMILLWHVPGGARYASAEPSAPQSAVEIEEFKQNNLFAGYVIVKYNLADSGGGKLRLRVYDSANPASADWFANHDVPLKSGPGMQLVKISALPDSPSPDVFKVDTMEIQLLDDTGKILATGTKDVPATWAKRK